MKVNKIIFACDIDYLNYYYHVQEFYNNYLDIDVVLLLFSNKNIKIQHNSRNSIVYFNRNIKKYLIPWSLFYGASLFPEDVVMTSGIDQIPLSDLLFDLIKDISQESYLISFSDAYKNQKSLINNNLTYPSSHHIGKGIYFKQIYNIKDTWSDEITKINKIKNVLKQKYPIYDNNFWGLDEAYSSHMINISEENNIEKIKNFFHDIWNPRRIDRGRNQNINIHLLKNGYYTEYHCPRPFADHEEQINKILNLRYDYNASSSKKYI